MDKLESLGVSLERKSFAPFLCHSTHGVAGVFLGQAGFLTDSPLRILDKPYLAVGVQAKR